MLAGFRIAAVLLLGIPFTLAAEPVHISGRVQAGGDQKQVEARIELLPQAGDTPVATAKTDAAGFFELTAPESGCFRVRLQAQGYASMENPLLLVREEIELLMPLVPAAGALPGSEIYGGWAVAAPAPATPPRATPRLVQGKVSDPQGRPVPGALVWSEGSPDVPCVKSGAGGAFQMRLPAGSGAKLRAVAPGYLASVPQASAPGSRAPFLLKLKVAGAITGRALDTDGHPLARVQVAAVSASGDDDSSTYHMAWSRADGGFRLPLLSSGKPYEVIATREGFASSQLKMGALPRDRPPVPLRIVLERGATALGRVLDREGKPVPDAHLILETLNEELGGGLFPVGGQEVAVAATNSQGGFAFQHLNPGRLHLRIERKGFAPFPPVEVEIPRTGRVDLGILTLDRGLAIAGRVIDPRGRPMSGVTVELSPTVLVFSEAEEMTRAFQQQTTDADGRFHFDDLPRGKRFDLNTEPPGYLPASVQSVEVPVPEPLTITLKTGRSLSGRVTGPAGEPVHEAEISLQAKRTVQSSLGDLKMDASRTLGTTDQEGGFRVQGVEPGTADLHIRAPGYRSRSQSVQVPEDGDVEGLEISLERANALEARALDASGAPVPRAELELSRIEARPWGGTVVSTCQTDAEGRCRMESLDCEPGWYRLSARAKGHGHGETTFELKNGVSTRDLVLHKGVEISGRVIDDAGDPVPGAALSLLPAGTGTGTGEPMTTQSSADGSFQLMDVDDGAYRLSGDAPGFADAQVPGEIQVAGQAVRGLELRLSGGARVTGKLLGLDPEEAKNVIIFVFRPDLASPEPILGKVDLEGRYRIENLGSGEWNVSAHTEGRSIAEPLHLAPGAREAVLDLRFQTGFTLSGRVLLDHAPLAGAQVVVFTPTRSFQALAGPDGGFQLSDLPADHYSLMALDSGRELIARKDIEIAADQEVTFDIVTGGLRGRISAAGAPVAGAVLHLEEAAVSSPVFPFAPTLDRTSDGSGTFEIPRIPAGAYKITVEKEGFAPATVSVQVSPGAVAAVEITLQPAS